MTASSNNIMSNTEPVSIIISNLKNQLEKLDKTVKNIFDDQFSHLNSAINHLSCENSTLSGINTELVKERESLKNTICSLEDDHKNFTKVSKLIALENENASLRTEVERLRTQFLNKSKVLKSPETPLKQEDKEEETDDNVINVFEKKIGKKVFFVDDNNNIYEKLDDDSVGENIGIIVFDEIKNKNKVVWNNV